MTPGNDAPEAPSARAGPEDRAGPAGEGATEAGSGEGATEAGGGEGLVPVVAAVVRDGERYLVGRRPTGKRHGGLWEFPGGKLRQGEAVAAAVHRELREELDLACTRVGSSLWSARDPGSPFAIDFVEVEVMGRPEALEHTEVGWFTVTELRAMPLAPTDSAFVAWLGEGGRG